MSTIEKAIQMALKAHSGQKEKAGAPYILHPLRVMLAMDSDTERMVAVMHDVIEDSEISIDDLVSLGFSEKVCHAVLALTKLDNEPYDVYLNRVKANPIALKVKLADQKDNMDLGRIANPTEKDFERIKKYAKAFKLLSEHQINTGKECDE